MPRKQCTVCFPLPSVPRPGVQRATEFFPICSTICAQGCTASKLAELNAKPIFKLVSVQHACFSILPRYSVLAVLCAVGQVS